MAAEKCWSCGKGLRTQAYSVKSGTARWDPWEQPRLDVCKRCVRIWLRVSAACYAKRDAFRLFETGHKMAVGMLSDEEEKWVEALYLDICPSKDRHPSRYKHDYGKFKDAFKGLILKAFTGTVYN